MTYKYDNYIGYNIGNMSMSVIITLMTDILIDFEFDLET